MSRFKKGSYIEYPCTNGCGHHMRLKDDIDGLDSLHTTVVECPTCGIEQQHSVEEIRDIVNYRYNLGWK